MRTIVAAVAIAGVALGVDAGLLSHEPVRDLLTPDPVKVVRAFVAAAAAARPEQARQQLAEAARARLSAEHIAARARELRRRHGDYRYEDADVRRHDEFAEVDARLRTQRDGTIVWTFRLVRDPKTYLWKITDADL